MINHPMYSFMVTCNKPRVKKKEQTLFDAARSKPQKNMAVTANPGSILCDPGLYRVQSVRLRDGRTRLHCDDVGVHKTKTPKKEGFNKPFLIFRLLENMQLKTWRCWNS